MNWYQHGARGIDALSRLLFLDEIIEGRRVLLVCDDTGSLSEAPPPEATFLLEIGAKKVVCALDDDVRLEALRSAHKRRRDLDFRALRDDVLPGDDGAFDLVVDFGLPWRLSQDSFFFEELDRVLSDQGFGVTALPNMVPGLNVLTGEARRAPPVAYRELAEALGNAFDDVEVFFQSLVLGYFMGSFSAEETGEGVAPHPGFLGDEAEPASYYMFTFGRVVPVVEDVSLVQLPLAQLLARGRGQALPSSAQLEHTEPLKEAPIPEATFEDAREAEVADADDEETGGVSHRDLARRGHGASSRMRTTWPSAH